MGFEDGSTYITPEERAFAMQSPGYKPADNSSYPALPRSSSTVQLETQSSTETLQPKHDLGSVAINGPANASGEISG